jgi:segregation and condensation protein B
LEHLSAHLEALIFASEGPITLKEIKQCIESLTGETYEKTTLQNKITAVQQKYWANSFPFCIEEIGGGYQFQTKEQYHDTISILLKQKSRKKLSKASLETLSLIAYKQPITKSEIERVRGVSCDYAVRKLLEKELIRIKGRSTDAGRPLLYATSEKFMQHFGLKSIRDLPKLREFKEEENQIGEINEENL